MKKLSLFIGILLVLFACKQTGSHSNKEDLVMYEAKPLALLMLQMYSETESWKEAIALDSLQIDFPADFYGIYTVEATDSNVRNEQFMAQADIYLKSVKDLVETKKKKKQIKKYNISIDACIACHSVFCQGPIDKIKKLYIKD